jgi:L-seryl-tRNA(Ser) seleniumtransferase
MLSIPPAELMSRCRRVVDHTANPHLLLDVVPVASLVGGGTAPRASLPSCAVSLRHVSLTAAELLAALRKLSPPVIGRIADDAVLLDLRTVNPRFDSSLVSLLNSV